MIIKQKLFINERGSLELARRFQRALKPSSTNIIFLLKFNIF
jgi:hypothetical protein